MATTTHIRKASLGLNFFRGILAFVLFSVLVIFWFRIAGSPQSYEEKRKTERLEKLKALHAEDQKKLESYSWADKSKGLVQIPIEQAMKLALMELPARPVHASAVKAEPPPLNTPLQQAAAPAASPAASPGSAKPASPAVSPAGAPAASPAASPKIKK